MRVTYRLDIRPTVGDAWRAIHGNDKLPDWKPQTRCKTRKEAEQLADTWKARGLEVQIVVER